MKQMLFIGEEEKQKIKEHIEHAQAYPYDVDQLKEIAHNRAKPPGERPGFKIVIPHRYYVVFTVGVLHDKPYKQISISIEQLRTDATPRLPSVPAVEAIMKEYGFKKPLKENFVNIEMGIAVNIVEHD